MAPTDSPVQPAPRKGYSQTQNPAPAKPLVPTKKTSVPKDSSEPKQHSANTAKDTKSLETPSGSKPKVSPVPKKHAPLEEELFKPDPKQKIISKDPKTGKITLIPQNKRQREPSPTQEVPPKKTKDSGLKNKSPPPPISFPLPKPPLHSPHLSPSYDEDFGDMPHTPTPIPQDPDSPDTVDSPDE